MVACAFSTLWTQCNEPYELPARRIAKTSPELLQHLPNVFCIIEMTEILIMIDVVCEVGNSLETPSDVIL